MAKFKTWTRKQTSIKAPGNNADMNFSDELQQIITDNMFWLKDVQSQAIRFERTWHKPTYA